MRPGEYVQQLGDLCVLIQPQGGERILPLASLGQCRMEILGPRGNSRECILRLSDPDGMALVSWSFTDYQEAEGLQALLLAAGRRSQPKPAAGRAGMLSLRHFLLACARIALGLLLAYLVLIGLSAIVTDTLSARLLGQTIQAGSGIQSMKGQDPADNAGRGQRLQAAQEVPGVPGQDQAGETTGTQAAQDTSGNGQGASTDEGAGFNPDRLFDYSCE